MSYHEYWEKIYELNGKLYDTLVSYWTHYSDIGSWQFWIVLLLLILPLIILYFTIDRKRIFELLFFGYTIHILWTYGVIVLEKMNVLIHPYFLFPALPMAVNLTASLLPVGYLLLYQYCTNHKKNFYVYAILLSVIFAFGLGTIEKYLNLIHFEKGMNRFWLLIIDLVVVFITYGFTRIIKKIRKIYAF